jgi:CheY-like chemotaxis protein
LAILGIPGVARDARILIADDNQINQVIAVKQLEKLGYRADAVANGNEVLDALRQIPYDLILMDCQMPELDGFAATAIIRGSKTLPNPKIPIIAMTANAMRGDREKCMSAGMDDYVSKPVKVEVLGRVIEQWLAAAQAAKKNNSGAA